MDVRQRRESLASPTEGNHLSSTQVNNAILTVRACSADDYISLQRGDAQYFRTSLQRHVVSGLLHLTFCTP